VHECGGAQPLHEVEPDRGGVLIVPSYLRKPSAAVCWNCDRDADETVAITLRAASGGETTLTLCRHCYDAAYVPLAARTEGLSVATGHRSSVLTPREGRSGPVGAQ